MNSYRQNKIEMTANLSCERAKEAPAIRKMEVHRVHGRKTEKIHPKRAAPSRTSGTFSKRHATLPRASCSLMSSIPSSRPVVHLRVTLVLLIGSSTSFLQSWTVWRPGRQSSPLVPPTGPTSSIRPSLGQEGLTSLFTSRCQMSRRGFQSSRLTLERSPSHQT